MSSWPAALRHQAFMGLEPLAGKLQIKEAQEIPACQLPASRPVFTAEAATPRVVYDPANEKRPW